MRLTYTIEGHGAGSTTVQGAEDAARVVDRAFRTALADQDVTALAGILHRIVGPLRMAMITDGATAVAQGREWASQSGPILVTLAP